MDLDFCLLSSVTLCACSMSSLQRIQSLRFAPAFPRRRRFFLTRFRVDAINKGTGSKNVSGFRQSRLRVNVASECHSAVETLSVISGKSPRCESNDLALPHLFSVVTVRILKQTRNDSDSWFWLHNPFSVMSRKSFFPNGKTALLHIP